MVKGARRGTRSMSKKDRVIGYMYSVGEKSDEGEREYEGECTVTTELLEGEKLVFKGWMKTDKKGMDLMTFRMVRK